MKWTWIGAAGACVLAFALAASQAQTPQAQDGATMLRVNAMGEAKGEPDMAMLAIGVEADGATAAAALADNGRRMTALLAALRNAGIGARDIQTERIAVSPRVAYHDEEPDEVVGYRASNSVRARVRRLDTLARVIDNAVAAGGNTLRSVSFGYQDDEAQRDVARRDAVTKARRRADLYAEALGMRVARVLVVAEPGTGGADQLELTATLTTDSLLNELPQIMPGQRPTPVAPGEITTRANVLVTFELR